MESKEKDLGTQNGAAHPSSGAAVPKSQAQGEKTAVKEGDPAQARPTYGSDAGQNTASREDQLPDLKDGAIPKEEEDPDEFAQQIKGSDADKDQSGESTF